MRLWKILSLASAALIGTLLGLAVSAALPVLAATLTDSSFRITGRLGVGGAVPVALGPELVVHAVGRTDARVQVDGQTSSGIYLTLSGADAGTIRATPLGIEFWPPGATTPALVIQLDGTLHVAGNVVVDGNIAAKYQ